MSLNQNDPILDIANYLVGLGFLNVFIDGFVINPNDQIANYNQITVIDEPSPVEPGISYRTCNFAIYVKNKSKTEAKNLLREIMKLLTNTGGRLNNSSTAVPFKRIWATTSPYMFSKAESYDSIYLARFTCIIGDNDLKETLTY